MWQLLVCGVKAFSWWRSVPRATDVDNLWLSLLARCWFIHHLEGFQTGSIFSYKSFDRNPEITRKKKLTSHGKGNKKAAFACETTSQNYEKTLSFLDFLIKTYGFT